MGRKLRGPMEINSGYVTDKLPPGNTCEYVRNLEEKMKQILELANSVQKRTHENQRKIYNKGRKASTFKVGDLCWLKAVRISSAVRGVNASLLPKFYGSFKLLKQVAENTF